MARIFRMSIRSADGTYHPSTRWYVEWADQRGFRRRWAGLRDKLASELLGRRLEALAEAARVGLPASRDDLEGARALTVRQQCALGRLGLLPISAAPATPGRSLDRDIADYAGWLLAGECSPRHVSQVAARIRSAAEALEIASASQLAADRIAQWLKDRRDAGQSAATSNHYVKSLRAFGRWLVRQRRLERNPLADLVLVNERADRRHDRAPLTSAEVGRLLESVKDQPPRYWLYRVALETGLRANELRRIAVADLDLGRQPTITVRAAFAKGRRTDTLPLSQQTAQGLREWLSGRPGEAQAFEVPCQTAKAIRRDLEAAGVKYRVPGGFRDFHSLRHTFLTEAGRHVEAFADLQGLARHSTPVLTARYAHANRDAMRQAVISLSQSLGVQLGAKVGKKVAQSRTASARQKRRNP